jgi:lysophospholipase L1-like esterase
MTWPSFPIGRLLGAVAAIAAVATAVFLVSAELSPAGRHAPVRAVVAAAKNHQRGIALTGSSGPSAPAATIHDVLFVGASYTAGLGATPNTEGYAYLIGREPGWRAQVDGVAGTGFLNPGPHGGQTFADRIAHLPTEPHPDLVVFQGGRNDVGYPQDKLLAAAIATADLAHRRFHGSQVVFLGPIPAHVPAPPGQIAVANTLRTAASASKSIFVNPIEQGWITPSNEDGYVGRVPAHPDNQGYAYIAQRLLTDLEALYPNHGNA